VLSDVALDMFFVVSL